MNVSATWACNCSLADLTCRHISVVAFGSGLWLGSALSLGQPAQYARAPLSMLQGLLALNWARFCWRGSFGCACGRRLAASWIRAGISTSASHSLLRPADALQQLLLNRLAPLRWMRCVGGSRGQVDQGGQQRRGGARQVKAGSVRIGASLGKERLRMKVKSRKMK